MTYIVTGRPPGTITYERRMRLSRKRNNTGKSQVVKRRRRVVAAHEHPYHARSTADDVKRRIEAMGWTDVEVRQDICL